MNALRKVGRVCPSAPQIRTQSVTTARWDRRALPARIFPAVLTAVGLLTLTVSSISQPSADSTSHSMQMAKLFNFHQTNTSELKYLLFLPKGYDRKSDQRWPLMLFLHGAGERGSDVWQVARHGPPKHIVEHPEFPFILVSPQCPQDQIWSNDSLLALLDQITRDYAVDTHRVYLTGLSMGGYGTWNLGLTYPERFAAIVPICGGGELITLLLANQQKADALKTLGIWAFHGGKDPVVPTEESQRMVDFAKKAGVQEVKLTIYPEALHDSWTETYNNPELYDWLLRHVRK